VVVCDMHMPEMSGVEVMSEFSKKSPATSRIMLTGNVSQDCAVEAINQCHVFGFLNKPCSTDDLIQMIADGLAHYRLLVREKDLMETSLAGSIKLLSDVVSLTDPAIAVNSRKVGSWAKILLPHLNDISRWELDFTVMLAPLGRMFVPVEILARQKQGASLKKREKRILLEAPEIGSRLLHNIPRMETISKAILYQNKNFDGSGFPNDDISGEEIPIISRLLRILNALLELVGNSELTGKHFKVLFDQIELFDPDILELARYHLLDQSETPAPYKRSDETENQDAGDEQNDNQSQIVQTALLREKHILGSDLCNIDGALLLTKGTVLSQAQVEKIRSMHQDGKLPETVDIWVTN
ncbi:MAG: hypothetical protein CFH10_01033, partial [Alphaproteobacteria bacterium MarineAlpha4_Bin2]